MPRIRLYFSYVGSRYRGWQRQKNTNFTIQEVMESKLSIISNKRISLTASGRTDAGVHARCQVAHADVPDHVLKLALEKSRVLDESRLKQSLNSLLPRDIRIHKIDHALDDFHSIRDSVFKTYLYFLDISPVQNPEVAKYSWHLRLPMDWEAIESATKDFTGRHDFKAFCGKNSTVKTTVRTIYEAQWGDYDWHGVSGTTRLKVFRVTGSGFLKNMVRSIVGTLVHIGNKKADPTLVKTLLQNQRRVDCGPTAPALGLWMWDVGYNVDRICQPNPTLDFDSNS